MAGKENALAEDAQVGRLVVLQQPRGQLFSAQLSAVFCESRRGWPGGHSKPKASGS